MKPTLAILAAVAGSVTLGAHAAQPVPSSSSRAPSKEIVVVFTGGRACCDAYTPTLRGPVDSIKKSVAAQALRRGAAFRAIGVSVDSVLHDGMEYLKQFGGFDAVGIKAPAQLGFSRRSTPSGTVSVQLVVYEHDVGQASAAESVRNRLVLKNLTGPKEIIAWAMQARRSLSTHRAA